MLTKRLDDIHDELRQIAEKEYMRVWRMARRAEAKGCSQKLVDEIRNEGWNLYSTYTTYPERLLYYTTKNDLKYAFCGERMRHHYITANGDHEIIKEEWR